MCVWGRGSPQAVRTGGVTAVYLCDHSWWPPKWSSSSVISVHSIFLTREPQFLEDVNYVTMLLAPPPGGLRAHSEQTNPRVVPSPALLPAVSATPHWALFVLMLVWLAFRLPCSRWLDAVGFQPKCDFSEELSVSTLVTLRVTVFSPLLHAHFSLLLVLIFFPNEFFV